MQRGALSEDINAEVGFVDLLIILLLFIWLQGVSFTLKVAL